MSRCFGHGSPLSVRPQVPHDYVTRVDVNLEVELLADQYNTHENQWVGIQYADCGGADVSKAKPRNPATMF